MYLFFDTETTGLPKDWKKPITDGDNWPRLVQLAWLAFDHEGNKLAGSSVIIKPECFVIPTEATKIHGITTERAMAEGVPLASFLGWFGNQLRDAYNVIGHNIQFDDNIIGAEFCRLKMEPHDTGHRICTMQGSADHCKIKNHAGGNKWPKLIELHTHLFGAGFEKAHDAAADIEATARCFWELRRLKVL